MTVHTQTYDDAVVAADVLDDCGALNVRERSRMLEDGMTRDERLHGSGPEIRVYPGINESDKDATPAQLENERLGRKDSRRSNSSIIERSSATYSRPRENDYLNDPESDSAYINPSDEEKKQI